VVRRVPSFALLRLDLDRHGRAHRLAQLAGDAAFLAVGIAALGVQAAESWRLGRFLFRELHRDLAREQELAGERHALDQLGEQEGIEEV
jgi:hypothetical protein